MAFQFGDMAVHQLRQLYRDFYAGWRSEQSGKSPNRTTQNRWAVLDEDLDAATAFDTAPATAAASLYGRNSGGDLYDTGETITVVNRFENISLVSGTLVKVEWIGGEWSPYSGDCG